MSAIVQSQTPEEQAYTRYLDEIEVRRRRVAELQTELDVLKEELGRFDAEYHSRVGALFVELDKLDLSCAEYRFRIARLATAPNVDRNELEQETRTYFAGQRDEVQHDEEETQRYQRTYDVDRRLPDLDDVSAAILKSLYRDLVKQFHPDLARTEVERQQREAIMKRINAAFHERSVDKLKAISTQTSFEDPSFESRPIGEKLVWAIRELSRLDGVIAIAAVELETLKTSELAVLWQRYQTGERVLELLERDLNRRIETNQHALDQLIEEFLAQAAKESHG